MQKKTLIKVVFITLLLLAASSCAAASDSSLTASGVVEAVEVSVAPQLAGRVAEVMVEEGDSVRAGDVLFRLEDDVLQAQKAQAEAAHDAAQANLDTARIALESAEAARENAQAGVDAAEAGLDAAKAALKGAKAALESAEAGVQVANAQLELHLAAARLEDVPNRAAAWNLSLPNEFSLPPWYFQKPETLQAAEAEVQSAQKALVSEQQNYQAAVVDAGNAKFIGAETRLANAQAAFLVAQDLKNRPVSQTDKQTLEDYVQNLFDAAKAELDAAQLSYDQLLSGQAAKNVLEARARLAGAQARVDAALDYLASLQTGEASLSVAASQAAVHQAETYVSQAETGIAQAEAGVSAAEAAVAQAKANQNQVELNVALAESGVAQAEQAVAQTQAALDLINLQIEKTTIRSALDGVVMTRNIEPGEIVQPGLTAMTISQLDQLTITVYLPEDRYGQVHIGDSVSVASDSFPDESFEVQVSRISDRAEYTPRNVQTKEDRQTTVYAVELSVTSSQGKLKPGMPVDVEFQAADGTNP